MEYIYFAASVKKLSNLFTLGRFVLNGNNIFDNQWSTFILRRAHGSLIVGLAYTYCCDTGLYRHSCNVTARKTRKK